MRELTTMEMEQVSGACILSRVGAAALGGLMGWSIGSIKYGVAGGNTGGLLGVGVISALVGGLWGGLTYAVQGATYGVVNDWDKTLATFNSNSEQGFDWNTGPTKS